MGQHDLKQAQGARKPQGFLGRLRADARGNTLAIAAASIIPITGAIGAGVDMSRAYTTRTRMQQACDAGVLAVRRNISGNTIDAASRTIGTQFYNVNFPPSTFGATTTSAFAVSSVPSTNAVSGTATVTLPYTLVTVLGFTSQPITVTCQASQDYVNTDIVLVLDNTGSMKCAPSAAATAQCSSEVFSNGANSSKMQGQRDAVMALYAALTTAQTQLEAKGLRLRYGIVPYSGTVNVGKLLYGTGNSLSAIRTTSPYRQVSQTCTGSGWSQVCATTNLSVPTIHSQSWLDNWASASQPSLGCIEERQSDNSITASTTSIPSGAWDLNLDMMPTPSSVGTQWPPYDTNAEVGESQTACPTPAKGLQAFTQAQMQTYVNSLVGDGGTYSDIGMIWGGRFISDAGVFAWSPNNFNGFPVKKYIILMTDGYIDTGATYYSAWGQEQYDHRASANPYPGDDTDAANHQTRFSLACSAAKSKGASIWVIGFGQSITTLDSTLTNCASSSDQTAVATTSAALITKFTSIGNQIGSLRVVG
ncbi:MAG: Flp pilus assembly protein TadG [Sphingomonadales bacterium]|nr:Flp pilus assembly protein TadG [Sphingomonadales bacterium]